MDHAFMLVLLGGVQPFIGPCTVCENGGATLDVLFKELLDSCTVLVGNLTMCKYLHRHNAQTEPLMYYPKLQFPNTWETPTNPTRKR